MRRNPDDFFTPRITRISPMNLDQELIKAGARNPLAKKASTRIKADLTDFVLFRVVLRVSWAKPISGIRTLASV